jgi:hypothetical protein
MSIICVLHGGLGNQLYQLFFAELLSRKTGKKLYIHQWALSRYSAARDFEIGFLLPTLRNFADAHSKKFYYISRLRLPKILYRLLGRERPLFLGPVTILDQYFQSVMSYNRFEPALLKELLREWSTVALLDYSNYSGQVVDHIRLGDFFGERTAAIDYAKARLGNEPAEAIMTDQEDIVAEMLYKQGENASAKIIPTTGFTAIKTLQTMAGFKKIRTNGSTLALWAAILGQRTFESSETMHQDFYNMTAS